MTPIIQIIRFWLGAIWYSTFVLIFILALALAISGTGMRTPIPWFYTEVRWNGIGLDQDIRVATSGEVLHSPELWSPQPEWPIRNITGILAIHAPNRLWAWLYNVEMTAWVGLLLALIHLLRRLFQSLKLGTPFTRENARRVRYIGLLIFAGTLLLDLMDLAQRVYLSRLVTTRGMVIKNDWDFDFSVLFLGLVVLVISEFFRHGVELEEERSLTV